MNAKEKKLLEVYFTDLYALFTKMLTDFTFGDKTDGSHTVKMQAVLQELIKIKKQILE